MMRKWIPAVVLITIVLIPAMALGAAFQGTIQGYNCVTQGQVCPIGKEDPMVAAESVFVLQTQDGDWHFVPNVDSKIMARHINEMVMIEGTYDSKFRSIKAENFFVMENMKWRKVWSQDIMDEIYSEYLGGAAIGGK